jgi:hypothetical protein
VKEFTFLAIPYLFQPTNPDCKLSYNAGFVNYFLKIYIFCAATDGGAPLFRKFWIFIAHNVPAVYDVFAVAIKEREAFQQPQKCGCSEPWERSDLGERNPGATAGSGA